MAQTDAVAVTKKLNFGTTPHRHAGMELLDPEEALVEALEHPTPESLLRAVTAVQTACSKRFEDVEAAALAMSEDVGEAGLRRLKRQFGSVKNSFLHFEVKESFITSLMEGFPSGDEREQLASFEAEVDQTLGRLRGIKADNAVLVGEIEALIEGVCTGREEAARQAPALLARLAAVQARVGEAKARAEAEALGAESAEAMERELGALRQRLAAEEEEARVLESELASLAAQADDADAAEAAMQADISALQAAAALRDAAARAAHSKAAAQSTDRNLRDWCAAAVEACAAFTGVRILRFTATGLVLALRVAYPTAAVPGGGPGALAALPCAEAQVEVEVTLLQPAQTPALVQAVRLDPATADVALPDLAGSQLPDAVEAVGRAVAGHRHRQALLASCPAASTVDPSLRDVRLGLSEAQSVAVSLEATWPQRQYDVITATLAGGTTHVFEGRGLTEVAGELAAVTVTTPQA